MALEPYRYELPISGGAAGATGLGATGLGSVAGLDGVTTLPAYQTPSLGPDGSLWAPGFGQFKAIQQGNSSGGGGGGTDGGGTDGGGTTPPPAPTSYTADQVRQALLHSMRGTGSTGFDLLRDVNTAMNVIFPNGATTVLATDLPTRIGAVTGLPSSVDLAALTTAVTQALSGTATSATAPADTTAARTAATEAAQTTSTPTTTTAPAADGTSATTTQPYQGVTSNSYLPGGGGPSSPSGQETSTGSHLGSVGTGNPMGPDNEPMGPGLAGLGYGLATGQQMSPGYAAASLGAALTGLPGLAVSLAGTLANRAGVVPSLDPHAISGNADNAGDKSGEKAGYTGSFDNPAPPADPAYSGAGDDTGGDKSGEKGGTEASYGGTSDSDASAGMGGADTGGHEGSHGGYGGDMGGGGMDGGGSEAGGGAEGAGDSSGEKNRGGFVAPGDLGSSGLARMGLPPNYAPGGMVNASQLGAPNPPGPDDGTAFLDGGEFVVRASEVPKYLPILKQMNQGVFPPSAPGHADSFPPDSDVDQGDYDYASAIASGASPDPEADMHWPDTFKRPSHPTFSTDSAAHGQNGNQGGQWTNHRAGVWSFKPGATNLQHHGAAGMHEYFRRNNPNDILIEDLPAPPGYAEGGMVGDPMEAPMQNYPLPDPAQRTPQIIEADSTGQGGLGETGASVMPGGPPMAPAMPMGMGGGMPEPDMDDMGGGGWDDDMDDPGMMGAEMAPPAATIDYQQPPTQGGAITPDMVMANLQQMPPDQHAAISMAFADPTVLGAVSTLLGDAFMPVLVAAVSPPAQGQPGMAPPPSGGAVPPGGEMGSFSGGGFVRGGGGHNRPGAPPGVRPDYAPRGREPMPFQPHHRMGLGMTGGRMGMGM